MSSKIKKCAHCGQEVASSAKICPSCGAKNKQPIYKKWWFYLIITVIAVAIVGGAGNKTDSSGQKDTEKNEISIGSKTNNSGSATSGQSEAQQGEGQLGDFYVKFVDFTLAEDYHGKPVVIANYEFTNNSDKTQSAMAAVNLQAFQDGIELENAITLTDYGADNIMKEIRPGATLDIHEAFLLTSESDVEFEISELISFSNDKVSTNYSFDSQK